MGNLRDISLAEAMCRFHQRVATYLADKQEQVQRGAFGELDHFPCWYCVKYLDKVSWLPHFPSTLGPGTTSYHREAQCAH